MSREATSAGANPFNPKVVLGMVVFGAAVFIALLWMIGAGMTQGSRNDGRAHVGSKGLTGYAALANLLEQEGHALRRVQALPLLKDPGLLVLTPPAYGEGKAIEKILDERRYVGPTVLVMPKWEAIPAKFLQLDAQDGWVVVSGTQSPDWVKDLGNYKVALKLAGKEKGPAPRWEGLGQSGAMPDARVQAIVSDYVAPLVTDAAGNVLAGYWHDHGIYPDLAAAADYAVEDDEDADEGLFPLLIIADPDLLNNWGMADEGRMRTARELIRLADGEDRGTINFDLTLNGFKRSPNLLTLAFQPPFLAATLCLLLAALVAGWRAFRRFGPALAEGRAIAFGKRALVANAAGLVRRSGRIHLLALPYAALLRDRLVRTLGLPRHAEPAETEAAIDRALAGRDADAKPFSHAAAQMRNARRASDLLRAGQALHDIERTLTR